MNALFHSKYCGCLFAFCFAALAKLDADDIDDRDNLLQAKRELTTASIVIKSLVNTGEWPTSDFLVGKVCEVFLTPKRRNYLIKDSLVNSDRTGSIRVLWAAKDLRNEIGKIVPLAIKGRWSEVDSNNTDLLNLRENNFAVDDDPFKEGRAIAFQLGKGPAINDIFLQLKALPSEWPDLFKEAELVREANREAFISLKLTSKHERDLRNLAANSNQIVRCMSIFRLKQCKLLRAEDVQKTFQLHPDFWDVAIISRCLLEAPELMKPVRAFAADNSLSPECKKALLLAAYNVLRDSKDTVKTLMNLSTAKQLATNKGEWIGSEIEKKWIRLSTENEAISLLCIVASASALSNNTPSNEFENLILSVTGVGPMLKK